MRVEGGLKGWHRLQRFEIAMTFPTIEAAAAHLGTHQSALIHQFKRLERDIGARLYHRSTPRQPMRPTQRGSSLLRALSRSEIQSLATRQDPPESSPSSPPERTPSRRGRAGPPLAGQAPLRQLASHFAKQETLQSDRRRDQGPARPRRSRRPAGASGARRLARPARRCGHDHVH
ncbi:MAG TPA: hypothetical protein DHU96_19345 [Actinobacteria bacterium]|nr:hypothetical protein [Actinomycetota bacterium]